MYAVGMDVSITALRAEVIITDRGMPVARLAPVGSVSLIDSLTEQGVLSKPKGPRPVAGRVDRVKASGPVSTYVSEQRR